MNGLSILAVICKWAGIALLALLLFFLLLVLLALFSPVNYHAEGKKEAAPSGSFGVSWLLGAIRCRGSYTAENGMEIRLKVFWLTLLGGERKEKKAKKEKKQEAETRANAPPADTQPIGAREKTGTENTPEPTPPQEPQSPPEPPKAQGMARRQAKTVRRVKLEEIAEPESPLPEWELSEEEEAFFTGEEPGEKAAGRIPPIVSEIIHMEGKKEILSALGKMLKRLLKGVLPGNLFLKGTFGTGDPASTGYVLAAAGVLTARFGSDIQIKGDFSKAAAEDVEIRIKGRIVPAYLLWAALAFLLAKPVRRALWKLWKARK